MFSLYSHGILGVVFTQCECIVPTESKNVCSRNKAETWTAETEQDSKVLTWTVLRPLLHSLDYPWSAQNLTTADVSSRICTVTNKSKSLTYAVASSFVCTAPLAVKNVVVTVSSSAEFRSSLLSMCIEAPASTTNSPSSGLVEDGAGGHQTSEGEKNVALSFSLSLWTLLHVPRVSAGASLLFQSLFLSPVLKFWSFGATLMRTSVLNHTLRWTLSFPSFHVS